MGARYVTDWLRVKRFFFIRVEPQRRDCLVIPAKAGISLLGGVPEAKEMRFQLSLE